jgi:hypothetical protein
LVPADACYHNLQLQQGYCRSPLQQLLAFLFSSLAPSRPCCYSCCCSCYCSSWQLLRHVADAGLGREGAESSVTREGGESCCYSCCCSCYCSSWQLLRHAADADADAVDSSLLPLFPNCLLPSPLPASFPFQQSSPTKHYQPFCLSHSLLPNPFSLLAPAPSLHLHSHLLTQDNQWKLATTTDSCGRGTVDRPSSSCWPSFSARPRPRGGHPEPTIDAKGAPHNPVHLHSPLLSPSTYITIPPVAIIKPQGFFARGVSPQGAAGVHT